MLSPFLREKGLEQSSPGIEVDAVNSAEEDEEARREISADRATVGDSIAVRESRRLPSRRGLIVALVASCSLLGLVAGLLRRVLQSKVDVGSIDSKVFLSEGANPHQGASTDNGGQQANGPCQAAAEGSSCFKAVTYAMHEGIQDHPAWYPRLSVKSSFMDFQMHLWKIKDPANCPMPCMPQSCLCLFDVDRTLTAKQGDTNCPGVQLFPAISDAAFGGGQLTLSALGRALGSTFCGHCRLGIVSAGNPEPQERNVLHDHLTGLGSIPNVWSGPSAIVSPLVIGCANALKAECAEGVVNWYMTQGVLIPPSRVHFFDDLTGNTAPFAAKHYNARQVSCASREGAIGHCGATPAEITDAPGVFNC